MFVRFLEELEDTKSPFEIIWPLASARSYFRTTVLRTKASVIKISTFYKCFIQSQHRSIRTVLKVKFSVALAFRQTLRCAQVRNSWLEIIYGMKISTNSEGRFFPPPYYLCLVILKRYLQTWPTIQWRESKHCVVSRYVKRKKPLKVFGRSLILTCWHGNRM